MSKDQNLQKFFSNEELKTIKEAIEDHRSTLTREPRSIYGKIVSTADRNITVNACLSRSYTYGKKLKPDCSDDELFERAYLHLKLKFGKNGYAKFFFKDEEYENFLKEIRKLLANKNLFIQTQKAYVNKLKHSGLI